MKDSAGPAHELFGSRKLRLAPQDYSPWTPPTDRFSGRSYPPASRHSGATTWSPGSDNPFISRGCGLASLRCKTPFTRRSRLLPTTGCGLLARQHSTRCMSPRGRPENRVMCRVLHRKLATDQKAVQRRGPGRVVLGSKPQLATTEKLVSWAEVRDCQELLPKSINCYD